MKILHISTEFTNGTKVYETLINEIIRQGYESSIFVPLRQGSKRIVIEKIREIPCFNQIDRALYFSKQEKVRKALEREFKPKAFDLVCAHTLFSTGYTAYKLNKDYGVPYTVSVINTDVNLFFKKMIHLRKIGIEILKNSSGIIFISEAYRDMVMEKYVPKNIRKELLRKSFVIPFAIDEYYLKNQPKCKKLEDDNTIGVVQVARDFDKNKNLKTSVKAVKRLIEKNINIELSVIGNISNKADLRLIQQNEFIRYIPFCPKEELIAYLRKSHILVMPSHYETFGLVYPEAMSQGLPVIYTRGQGFDRQFDEGKIGFSVKFDDEIELANNIIRIVENYKYMSDNSLKYARKFSADIVAKQYIDIFEKVLKR